MTDDHGDRMHEVPSRQDTEPPRGSPASILNALDMAGVREIEITF